MVNSVTSIFISYTICFTGYGIKVHRQSYPAVHTQIYCYAHITIEVHTIRVQICLKIFIHHKTKVGV